MEYLEVIDLRLNRIGDDGFKELIKSEKLSKIRDLKLDLNKITFNGTQQLSVKCNIPGL